MRKVSVNSNFKLILISIPFQFLFYVNFISNFALFQNDTIHKYTWLLNYSEIVEWRKDIRAQMFLRNTVSRSHSLLHAKRVLSAGYNYNFNFQPTTIFSLSRHNSSLTLETLEDIDTEDLNKLLHPALLQKAELNNKEFKELEENISKGDNFNVNDSKKYTSLLNFVNIYSEFKNNLQEYNDLKELYNEEETASESNSNNKLSNEDLESIQLMQKEVIDELKNLIPTLKKNGLKLKQNLLPPSHPFLNNSCILELRPGVGGHESNIFTEDLLEMYIRFSQVNNWRYEVMSKTNHASGKGIVEATLWVNQPGSYDRLRHEAGVHRVQRVPETETKGRVHTSASGVVVLPKIDETDTDSVMLRKFKPDELRIDVMRASGSGGQHVNTTESAVRITHLPTGITVNIQDERSQHKNKDKAMTILRSRLAEREMREKTEKERASRLDQVSTVDRSDKIRTYNYQQNRVTDHRCNFTLYDLENCMNGTKLDEIIDAVESKETNERANELISSLSK
ncbi:hypothetical protein B5S31_g5538 [[Candida] boidinii]|nr:hypothetical protein B5S31_g5538 [[Candida] boidinii]